MGVDPAVQHTSYLAAAARAEESDSARPRLNDPYASTIVESHPEGRAMRRNLLSAGIDEVIERTVTIDNLVTSAVEQGERVTVLNLGAGFCTRPQRLQLEGCREYLECDDKSILATKEKLLPVDKALVPLRRVELDVRDHVGLTALLSEVSVGGGETIVLSEGVLVYLPASQLTELARQLATIGGPTTWLTDVVSEPSAVAMQELADKANAGVSLYGLADLAPFEDQGWNVSDYRPMLSSRRGGPARPSAATHSRAIVDGVVELRHGLGGRPAISAHVSGVVTQMSSAPEIRASAIYGDRKHYAVMTGGFSRSLIVLALKK